MAAAANRARTRSSSLSSVPNALATMISRPPGRMRGANSRSMRRGGEVVGLGDGVDLGRRVGVRAHPGGGVGEDDVDLAQLGGERGDRVGVADVEDAAFDPGAGGGQRGGRGPDPFGVAAGEQDAVGGPQTGGEPGDQRAAEPLVGAR